MKPKLLDLCCGQGGASRGYELAGFEVVGVDIWPQPHYPYEFHEADALEFLEEHGHEFQAIHASFPCQAFSKAQRIRNNHHFDLITPGRELLEKVGKPWVMENVPGAPLNHPVELCGCMFGDLNVYRERWFEFSQEIRIEQPAHEPHAQPTTKMGRPPQPGTRMHVVGNFSGVAQARTAMDIGWMTRDGLREAIPPAYTYYIGMNLIRLVMHRA